MGLFNKTKKVEQPAIHPATQFESKFKEMECAFLLNATTPSTISNSYGLPMHYSIDLTLTHHGTFGPGTQGNVTTFSGDTLVSSEGIFECTYADRPAPSIPHSSAGADYFITTISPSGEFEHTYLSVEGTFSKIIVVTPSSASHAVYHDFDSLPENVKTALINHNQFVTNIRAGIYDNSQSKTGASPNQAINKTQKIVLDGTGYEPD